jgi:hypothetical protein
MQPTCGCDHAAKMPVGQIIGKYRSASEEWRLMHLDMTVIDL